MNSLNISIELNQLLFFLKQQLTYSERKKLAKLLEKEDNDSILKEKD